MQKYMRCFDRLDMTIMSALLQIKNLKISFLRDGEWNEAVHGVSFEVPKGKTLGIVGESGSGKSVSNLAVMRLLNEKQSKITADEITLDGKDILHLSENEMHDVRGKRIAMIFQEPMTSLNPVFQCGFQVTEAILAHEDVTEEEAKSRVITLFKKVLLPRPEAIYKSYPHELSGGQKQRVMIAMALACNPELLIADEPTTALDVTVQKEILKLLHELQKSDNLSMIFISHDLGVVSEVSDYIAVMHSGNIVEYGEAQEILNNPKDPYTKGLLACRPPMDYRLKRLPIVKEFLDGTWREDTDFKQQLIVTQEEREDHLKEIYSREPLLKVEHLKTWFPLKKGLFNRVYDHVKAVDDVCLDVYPGETLGLVGESGCGKTTLGRSILRLVEPSEGKIIFEGKDVMSLSGNDLREYRKHAQIVFQDPYSSLNPKMRVGDAIAEPMSVHGLEPDAKRRRDKVCELLTEVGLQPEHYQRYPHEFSGGQRQRICIARALAVHPKLIICDESVSALDVSVQAQVLNLLNRLKKDFGFTYIFISHDLSVVRFMSDRILVMYNGCPVELGDADEIFNNPKNEYTKKLINAIPSVISSVVEKSSVDGNK
ncbi:MAG: ABC transporter ATP-binding protein [Bacteroidales bacterium]|nr:ABC transporter ATP-binding protein [Bacteroidales bacterium]MBO7529418.1 ABC transporter ATP-binding protein [Bacteroidales bacterium]